VLRTTAFVAVPIGFALAVVGAGLVDRAEPMADPIPGSTRGLTARRVGSAAVALVGLAVAFVFVVEGIERPSRSYYLPLQDWQGVARHVERAFPDGTRVGSTQDPTALFRLT